MIKKLESQFWQENYLVKLTEIELCPNQSNQDLQSDGHNSEGPLKLGWDNTNESSSEE